MNGSLMMNDIYKDGSYHEHDTTWHEEDSPWKASQIARIIKSNNLQPSTVCEIGCGAGGILQCLYDDLGDDIVFTGYEVSPQAYEMCRSKTKHNMTFVLEYLLTVDQPTLDLILAIDVF